MTGSPSKPGPGRPKKDLRRFAANSNPLPIQEALADPVPTKTPVEKPVEVPLERKKRKYTKKNDATVKFAFSKIRSPTKLRQKEKALKKIIHQNSRIIQDPPVVGKKLILK